jgi:putative oxidoreductase
MSTLLDNTFSEKYTKAVVHASASLLILLFVYTALSKWLAFDDFKAQMHNQEVASWVADGLVWLLPPVEIMAALLLLFEPSRYAGFWMSFILMAVFTGYIGLVVAGYYERTPCSCGGVLKSMGWTAHLLFNCFFLLLSLFSIYQINRERRIIGTDK